MHFFLFKISVVKILVFFSAMNMAELMNVIGHDFIPLPDMYVVVL